jgi:transcriptional regulator GlxA family with amidase domain
LISKKGLRNMTVSVAIYVFPELEMLDFAGPYEVFATASRVHKNLNIRGLTTYRGGWPFNYV